MHDRNPPSDNLEDQMSKVEINHEADRQKGAQEFDEMNDRLSGLCDDGITERGSAEDDEILAKLRAISAKSDSSNRFQEEGNVAEEVNLDSFFGNVIGFDNILGEEDAISSAMGKKAHPLVRKGAFEFLGRCIERSSTAGPCGSINVGAAESISQLCCDKLNDQDAGVRKEACSVLKALFNSDDTKIRGTAEHHINGLQKSNPRVYKTLLQPSNDVPSNAPSPSRK